MRTLFVPLLGLISLVPLVLSGGYDGPRIYKFCGCMKVGEAFHVKGKSRQDQKDFVIQMLNNVDKNLDWGNRENYETPFHIHMWFVHPKVKALQHHYEIAYGAGMKKKFWDKVENMPLNLNRGQDYHYTVRKINGGFSIALNGRVFKELKGPRWSGCTNAAYVTFTHINEAWKENDPGCTEPAPKKPAPAPKKAAPAPKKKAPAPKKAAPKKKPAAKPVHNAPKATTKSNVATLPPAPGPVNTIVKSDPIAPAEDC